MGNIPSNSVLKILALAPSDYLIKAAIAATNILLFQRPETFVELTHNKRTNNKQIKKYLSVRRTGKSEVYEMVTSEKSRKLTGI